MEACSYRDTLAVGLDGPTCASLDKAIGLRRGMGIAGEAVVCMALVHAAQAYAACKRPPTSTACSELSSLSSNDLPPLPTLYPALSRE